MDFAKVVSVLHHRVRTDCQKPPSTGSGRFDLKAHRMRDHKKLLLLLSFAMLFAGLRAALCTEKMTAISSMAKSRTLVCLVFLSLLPSHLRGVGRLKL